jgi:ribose transport system ATP-binding protein
MASGIAFVHQELNLFDNLTVAANIFIGREPLTGGLMRLIDTVALTANARPLIKQLGAEFSAEALVGSLSLAEKQLVEIAKALSLKARLVIMDEPTSSLTAAETERLLNVIARLRADGVSTIFISHRLAEVERAADRVIVLRDGRQVAALAKSEIQPEIMIRHMIGRDLKTLYRAPARPPGQAVIELIDLKTAYRPEQAVRLAVRQGEILGLAGLVGSGRTELARTIFGLDAAKGGEIRIAGEPVSIAAPRDAIDRGIYLVPEDRKRSGLVLGFPVRDNITLANLSAHAHGGLVDRGSELGEAEKQRKSLDIRCPGTAVDVASLSGGNQQKALFARALGSDAKIVLMDDPMRGVDYGTKLEVYQLIREEARTGRTFLWHTTETDELDNCDRVYVFRNGRIVADLDRAEITEEKVIQSSFHEAGGR